MSQVCVLFVNILFIDRLLAKPEICSYFLNVIEPFAVQITWAECPTTDYSNSCLPDCIVLSYIFYLVHLIQLSLDLVLYKLILHGESHLIKLDIKSQMDSQTLLTNGHNLTALFLRMAEGLSLRRKMFGHQGWLFPRNSLFTVAITAI